MKISSLKNNKGFTPPNKAAGFTLVEALFAVLILTFTIAGLMTIVANSLFSARYAKDEITVIYLLQEVVDYVQNDRDTTVVFGSGTNLWDTFYTKYSNNNSKCSDPDIGCYFDVLDMIQNPSTAEIKKCPTDGGCPYIYYDANATTTPFYISDKYNGMIGKVKTNFQRKIVVTKSDSGEIIVIARVDWKNGSLPMSRSLSISLLNWLNRE